GFLFAKNDFYDKNGNLVRQDNLDQFKTNTEDLSGVNGRLAYTEPLWKNTFLELNYRFSLNRNDAERNTLEKSTPGGKYENIVDTLSNHFIYNNNTHTGGFTFRLNEKKYSISVGSSLGSARFNLDDINTGAKRSIQFTNFLPTVGLTFNPKKQMRIRMNYSGTTRNPTLQQIQPFIDNIDPLNITIGNPNLKQEFRHNINFNFSDYKVLKSKNIYLSANFTTTNNAITNANFIDSIGRRVNQAINVNGNYSGNLWSRYGFDIFPTYNLNFGFSPTISRFVNRVNGIENVSNNNNYGFDIGLGHWSEKKLSFYTFFNATLNNSKSSIRPNIVTRFWSYTSYLDLSLKLPAKLFLQIDSRLTMFQKTAQFANSANVYIVNSSLKKTFGKSDKLEMKVSINDIFNNNQNIRRNISTNFITETIQQNIQRFWLFTIAYNFSKNGKPTPGF
ncbi:MAG: outer membrane beta-barrel family protein, partial [Sediminibacterium sp.]|nr:outer membrane beta-barrel family protein [Sediminibacterium sp.]